jgi:hypothetical protein
MARFGIFVLVCALLAAGCGTHETSPGPPKSPETPVAVLSAYVRAAARSDLAGMWALLSRASRRRLGGTLAGFRRRYGAELEEEVSPLGMSRLHEELSEPITARWAVAEVAGRRGAYAAALRLEPEGWRLELRGPIRIRPLRPDPNETVSGVSQLAAEATGPSALGDLGIWLDGQAVPGKYGGTSSKRLTLFTQPGQIEPGRHSVAIFVSAGGSAAAFAWSFRSLPAS